MGLPVLDAKRAHLTGFYEESDYVFLKTIIPSRKATRDFGMRVKNESS